MSIPVYLFVRRWDGEADYLLNGMLGANLCEDHPALLLACNSYPPILTHCPPQLTVRTLENLSDAPSIFAEVNPHTLLVAWPINQPLSQLQDYLPADHEIVQTGVAFDSKSFDLTTPIAQDWFQLADVIIFTRCNDDGAIALRELGLQEKTEAGLYLQYEDDFIEPYEEEFDVCPFDLDADLIDISLDEFGIWYFDLMEQPDRYIGRSVSCAAILVQSEQRDGALCLARNAKISGQEEISLLSLPCKGECLVSYPDRTWLQITAEIGWERNPFYQKKGAVLHVTSAKICEVPEGHIVHF